MLRRRLQVLIDDGRYERLQRASRRHGAPVGELVRRAIDREYPEGGEPLDPRQAAELLLAADAPAGAEPDWQAQKPALLDEVYGGAG